MMGGIVIKLARFGRHAGLAAGLVWGAASQLANAQTIEQCAAMPETARRMECYDAVARSNASVLSRTGSPKMTALPPPRSSPAAAAL